jgi:hypothetical protein
MFFAHAGCLKVQNVPYPNVWKRMKQILSGYGFF